MSKKSFKTSFDDLLGHSNAEPASPKTKHKYQEIKYTFVIRCDHLDKIKAISYLERKMIKHVIADSLEAYIENYERSTGPIQLPKA